MKILLLEDLDSFHDAIRDGLATRRAELGEISITRVATELEFRRQLRSGALVAAGFNFAIFDVMVGWCTPEETMTKEGGNPPPEVEEELRLDKRWRSGVRCRRMFAEALVAANAPPVPCLFYTVLERESLHEELTAETELVVKQGDIDSLVSALKRATGPK